MEIPTIDLPIITGDPYIDGAVIAIILSVFIGVSGIIFLYFFVWRKMRDTQESIERDGIELKK